MLGKIWMTVSLSVFAGGMWQEHGQRGHLRDGFQALPVES